MNSTLAALAVLVAFPALIVMASFVRVGVEPLRRLALMAAGSMLVVALGVAVNPGMRTVVIRSSMLSAVPGGEALVRVDALSSALLPFAAGLWLLTAAVTPRAALDRGGLRRTALATLLTVVSFMTESAVALLVLWIASVWTFLSAIADPLHRHQRRVVAAYMGISTVLFGAGVVLMVWPMAQGTRLDVAGMWLVVVAALIRKGIFPFHAWVPEVFDHGRLGPAILFSAPQLGAYVTVVLIVPRASPDVLRLVAILALGTAVYGAALAVVQNSARRACGYLFVSQSALIMAGLDGTSVSALAGGLLLWLSAGVAFAGLARCVLVLESRRAGLARCVLVLESRRGRLDLSTHHGGYDRMPVLAISFLAMGLACTGFPGTLSFAGQELLVDGAVDAFPVLGFAVVIASALTGLAVLRMYFALFCGRRDTLADSGINLGLTRREAWTFTLVVVTLVGLGLLPRPIVDSRFTASEEILKARELRLADIPTRNF